MILYNTRLEQMIDDVITYGLKQGLLLDSNEFKALLTNEMRKQNLEQPLFSFEAQNDHYTLGVYNQTKQDLEKDFNVFFRAIITIYKKLQENIEKYRSLKTRRENQIEDLGKKLREILFKYAPLRTYTTFEETLTTLDNINDMSSVVVDCGKREVSLAKNVQTVSTFGKPRMTCTGFDSSTFSGIIQDFSAATGSIFAYVDTPRQSKLKISLDYNMSQPIFIGTLDIGFNYIKTESVEILIDGYAILSEEPISKKTIEVNNWVSNLQINFTKKEADQRTNNTYRYFCGIDYIQNTVHDYGQCGVLKTKAIPLQNTTQAFSISVDDYVPANTNIQYEYSLDGETWNELAKEERYFISDIKQVKTEYLNTVKPYKTANFSVQPLFVLEQDITAQQYRNTKLFRYHNQWCVSTYMFNEDKESESKQRSLTDFTPSLLMNLMEQKLINVSKQETPLDIRTKLGELDLQVVQKIDPKACLYKLSTYVQATTVESAMLAVNNAQEGLQYYIYLNGSLLKNASEYLIKQGWNLIEIYFVNDKVSLKTEIDSPQDNLLFSINFPASDHFLNILGVHTPMEEQSIEAMRFSKTIDRSKAYCIDSDKNLIISDKGDNIRYYVVREYTVDSLDKLYLKATLTSKIKSATPKIYGFNLHEF